MARNVTLTIRQKIREWKSKLSADIRISAFDDRIEIYSPGGTPEGLTIEDIKNSANAKRNPILVKALDKMRYIENYTSGIQRILNEYDGFPLQPEFYITDVLFKVTLYNKNYYYDQLKMQEIKEESKSERTAATVNATANEILDLMRRDRNVTLAQLVEITSKHRATIARNVKLLREAGLIKRVGSDKTGYWQVLQ